MKKLLLVLLPLVVVSYFWWKSFPRTVQGPLSGLEFEYIVRTTAGGGSSERLPMVISLHGSGDNPSHFYETLLEGFDRPARFVLLNGNTWPTNSGGLREYGDALADAVPVLLERFPTKGKPIVLGFSAGAYYAYYLAARHAERFSYIFPLSGKLYGELAKTEAPPYINGARVIAFHGTRDQVVGFSQGKAAVESLRKRGLSAELVTFAGEHIDIFLSERPAVLKRLGGAVKEIVH